MRAVASELRKRCNQSRERGRSMKFSFEEFVLRYGTRETAIVALGWIGALLALVALVSLVRGFYGKKRRKKRDVVGFVFVEILGLALVGLSFFTIKQTGKTVEQFVRGAPAAQPEDPG